MQHNHQYSSRKRKQNKNFTNASRWQIAEKFWLYYIWYYGIVQYYYSDHYKYHLYQSHLDSLRIGLNYQAATRLDLEKS